MNDSQPHTKYYKIAVVVHGRFHGFDLARELLALGHDVTLFTNYPRFVAGRFGIPKERVRTYLVHGFASRALWKLFPRGLNGGIERTTNLAFGRWAAREVLREAWDVVIGFSGISEAMFRALSETKTVKILQRGSAHIRVQHALLKEEAARIGRRIETPSDWIVAREEREYSLADAIHVLSTFALESFVAQGVNPHKLFRLSLGVNTRMFRPTGSIIEQRCQRILNGEPIHVLNVGNFSYQKGIEDLAAAIRTLDSRRFSFRCVGAVAWEARRLRSAMASLIQFKKKQRQFSLPLEYQWGDVFVLATIQDGFAVVLTQALASGLPLIATTNCSAPDLVREGETGWVIPIRCPQALVERLRWCDEHRSELAQIVRQVYASWQNLDWSETGKQADGNIREVIAAMSNRRVATTVEKTS